MLSQEDAVKATVTLGIVAVDVAWMLVAGYHFRWLSLANVMIVVAVLLAISELYRTRRPNQIFFAMTRETAWMLAFSAAAAVLSNLVVTLDFPIIDAPLVAADHLLGFHWHPYYRFFTSNSTVGLVASLLYVASLPMVGLAIIGLSLIDRTDRVRELVLAVMIGAIIAITISAVLPSAGALLWYHPAETQLIHHPVVDLSYKQTFNDLRSGVVSVFSLDGIKGLIAFPSFHATLSVLVVLAFRGMPRFYWPLGILAIAILATTPVEGGHHLVDTLAGILVAVLSVWLAVLWRRRLTMPRRSPEVPAVIAWARLGSSAQPSDGAG